MSMFLNKCVSLVDFYGFSCGNSVLKQMLPKNARNPTDARVLNTVDSVFQQLHRLKHLDS